MKGVLKAYNAHHYPQLVKRWQRLLASRELAMHLMIEAGGFPIYYLETKSPRPNNPWLYCSAGIHGDEAAGPEALIQWAERSNKIFQKINILLFPCLNPWGLVNNQRNDAQGQDLNRTYHTNTVPQTVAHKRLLIERKFALALCLHEDYDARGVYIYETKAKEADSIAEQFITVASAHIPPARGLIEGGFKCRKGVIRRIMPIKVNAQIPLGPEASFIYFSLNSYAITIETPSEFHLDHRVAAQVAILRSAAQYIAKKSTKN